MRGCVPVELVGKGQAAPLSEDATLRTLSLSGVDIGAFSADSTVYAASVAHEVASTTVTATASHSAAKVTIEPGSEVSLAIGENAIAVTVTAEDGSTTRSYRVTVTRAEEPALPVVSVAAVEERLVGPIGEFRVSRTGPRAEALQVQVLFANSRSFQDPDPLDPALARPEQRDDAVPGRRQQARRGRHHGDLYAAGG